MDRIIRIIAKRDSIDEDEACRIVEDAISICRGVLISGSCPSDVEDAWTEETGLEPDYLYDVLY